MIDKDDARRYCKALSPPDAERAVRFNEVSRDEAVIALTLFMEQNKLPRQVCIQGYNEMYFAAALFLAKKYSTKVDDHLGGSHKKMRDVLDFYTQDSKHHKKLIDLYEEAVNKFQVLIAQYHSERHFADRVVRNLIDEGYYQGKKAKYYDESQTSRKDPLLLDMGDAKRFISEIVEPFLYIMEALTK